MGSGVGPAGFVRASTSLVDDVRRRLSADGVVVVTGGRGAGRTTVLRGLDDALPGSWHRVDVAEAGAARTSHPTGQLLVVDDLHLVGTATAATIADLRRTGTPLLASITDESEIAPAVRAVVLDALLVTPPPLTDKDIAATAARTLGAEPDDIGIAQLATASGRRPGLLLRLLHGLTARLHGDVAVLPRDVAATDGAIAWRRERLPSAALHRAARLVGRGEQLRRDQIAAVVGAAAVEEGITAGLLAIDGDGLRVRDPLVAAVVAGSDRVTHGAADARALLERADRSTERTRRDRWAVEAGAEVEPTAMARTVRTHLDEGRPELAVRMGGADSSHPIVRAAAAQALAATGQSDRAAAILAELVDSDDPAVRRVAAVRLADHRFFRKLDPVGALDALARVEPADDPVARESAMLTMLVRSVLGQTNGAAAAVAGPDAVPPVVRLVTDLRAALAGRVEDPEQVAVLSPDTSPAGLPLHERSRTNRSFALLHARGVAAAQPAVDEEVRAAVASGRPGALALAASGQAQLDLFEGRLVRADRRFRAALLRAAIDDEAGLPPVLRAARATTLAELGALDEAAEELDTQTEQPPVDLRVRLYGAGARVRLLAATDRAAAVAAANADIAVGAESGHNVWAVLGGLHAARVGLAEDVADAVLHAADGTTGLAAAAASAVLSLADGQRADQRRAADDLARLGLRRVAAELLLQPGATDAEQRRAAAHLAGLGPPRPAFAVAAEALTPREEQVARLAADGSSSRDVASRLGVSVRTVDNHLRRVYRKLGLDGRDGLAALFGVVE